MGRSNEMKEKIRNILIKYDLDEGLTDYYKEQRKDMIKNRYIQDEETYLSYLRLGLAGLEIK